MINPAFKIASSRAYRFLLSLFIGVVVGGIILAIFSAYNPQWIGQAALSAMTYSGFALTLFGFFYKRNQKNFTADFILGLGIGLILVWFVGAGNGTITTIDLNY